MTNTDNPKNSIFPPQVVLDQLDSDGIDIKAMRDRYERMFPSRLCETSDNDLLWFARFAVDRRRYLRALDAVEQRVAQENKSA